MSAPPKWSVRKRDGAWLALDRRGHVQFASNRWIAAVSYALMGAAGKTDAEILAERIRNSLFPFRFGFGDDGPTWPGYRGDA